jgi:hypothetical protein
MKIMKAISSIIATAIGQYVGASVKTDKIKVKVVDTLVSEGITSEMLVAPKKGEDVVFYGSVKAAVVAGFASNVQALLDKDTKTLSDAQKSDKRYWQQQIGSKIKDLRNALVKRESQGEEGEARGNVASFEARLKRDLAKYIAQIEKGEAFEFAVVEMLKHLKSASVLIK